MKNNNFEIKNIGRIFKAEFKMRMKNLIVWSGAMFAILLLYMLLFPSVKEIAIEKLEAMPAELLAMFGMSAESDFANYNTYFSSIFQIILLVLCAYASVNATNSLHDEETTGSIEFLNSCKVSRIEIYVSKVLVVLCNLTIITILSFLAIIISGAIVATAQVDAGAIFATVFVSYLAILVFAGIGFLISALLKKSVKASNIALGVFFGTYIIGYLSNIGPDFIRFMKWFSPIDFLSPNLVMNSTLGIGNDTFNVIGIILGLIIILGSIIGGYFVYKKKDL